MYNAEREGFAHWSGNPSWPSDSSTQFSRTVCCGAGPGYLPVHDVELAANARDEAVERPRRGRAEFQRPSRAQGTALLLVAAGIVHSQFVGF